MKKPPLDRVNERMKNQKHDELDVLKSLAVAPRGRRKHPISKITSFADISFRVGGNYYSFT
jgi:hypothetical protein